MLIITTGLISSFLSTWAGIVVLACKSKDTPAPAAQHAPTCTDGHNIKESDYVVPDKEITKEDAGSSVPGTVYVEVLVAFDEYLYQKIGKSYNGGKLSSASSSRNIDAEVKLYARKFLSAVNIKFQDQFKNPKIVFVLREAFKHSNIPDGAGF